MKNVLLSLVLGAVVGGLGVVVHAGFVDLPEAGPVAGAILLASGAWFVEEWFGVRGWVAYAMTALGVTCLELLALPTEDIVLSMTPWVSRAWLLVAPVSMLVPSIVKAVAASVGRRRDSGLQAAPEASANSADTAVEETTPQSSRALARDPAGRVVRKPAVRTAGEPRHDARKAATRPLGFTMERERKGD